MIVEVYLSSLLLYLNFNLNKISGNRSPLGNETFYFGRYLPLGLLSY